MDPDWAGVQFSWREIRIDVKRKNATVARADEGTDHFGKKAA
jgi:hypothetical protein